MTTPSGALTMQNVISELGQTSVGGFDMNRSDVRALAHVSMTSGTPYNMTSLQSRRCINGALNIGRNSPFNDTYGFNSSGGYGAIAPTSIDGLTATQLVRLSSGGLQVLWATNRPNVHAILLRATTAPIAGSLPSVVVLTSQAVQVGIPGDPNVGWNWQAGVGIPASALDNWVNLLGQTVNVQYIMN